MRKQILKLSMKLTINQALQRAIAAHKKGNLQESERLYKTILQSQPAHADANHNLGLIAVSFDKVELALPLFKIALETNPKVEQFWLSYIEALIKENKLETAKAALQQGRKVGLVGEKVDVLQSRLKQIRLPTLPKSSKTGNSLTIKNKSKKISESKQQKKQAKNKNANRLNPSKSELNTLLEHYQNQQYTEAEKLAITITQQFPEHQFGWKVLGTVLQQTGRFLESLDAKQRAVELSPQDAEAHSNLGNSFTDLGILDKAESSYRQAIVIKSDYVEAHCNLGTTLQKLGRLEEAEASYMQAITLKPDYAEAHYNLGVMLQELSRFEEAGVCYRRAIALKPDHAKALGNLGNTLKKLGRLEEAEASYIQSIALKSDYTEVHSNLGTMLQEQGRLEESEASYTQAIALKPDFAEAHSNLGNTLKELGRLEEAESSYRQAIALKPDYVEAHSNLGATFQELGRLEEAEASYRQAITLKSSYAEAHSNLGTLLQKLGSLEKAEASYRQAIEIKPDYTEAMLNLSAVLDYMHNIDESVLLLEKLLKIDRDNLGLRAAVNLAIFRFLEGDFSASKKLLLACQKIQEKTSFRFKNGKIYQTFLLKILSWHSNKLSDYIDYIPNKKIYVIGESHSLTSHGIHVQSNARDALCQSFLIKGCKQSDLSSNIRNQYKIKFEGIFCSFLEPSEILLAIGEIDCRLNSGIIKHRNKYPGKNLVELIKTTIENYIDYIFELNSSARHNIIIQGVPCPNISTKEISTEEIMELINVIREFNEVLKSTSNNKGFGFLDLHKLTDRGDGFSNTLWHLDAIHLSPEGMQEAWRRHVPQ